MAAADRLALAVAEIEPNPDYGLVSPQALLVGGYVRDKMLGLDPKDADLEVFGVDPAVLKALCEKLFGASKKTGSEFNVLKVPVGNGLELDVSIPRTEKKTGEGHSDFLIDSDPSLDFKVAAARRDFTVNAMMEDPLTGVVFDPHGGLEDMAAKVLRVTDERRFIEDPLRVLRAMQFVARLGFAVDPRSETLMREMVTEGMLAKLPPDRIRGELEKLLMKGVVPSTGFAFGKRIGAIDAALPELADEAVWNQVLSSVDAAARLVRDEKRGLSEEQKLQTMLAAMVLPLDVDSARRLFDRLTFSKTNVGIALAALAGRSEPARLLAAVEARELGERAYRNEVRKVVRDVGKDSWRVLLAMAEIDYPGSTALFERTIVEHKIDTDGMKELLGGKDLILTFKIKPGKQIGEILDLVEAARDADTILTKDDAIAFVRGLMK